MKIYQRLLAEKFFLFSLLALLFSACAPTAVPTPTLIPEWIKVQYSPSLGTLKPDLNACLPAETGLAVQQAAEADVSMIWSAPEKIEGYATELGSETLVVVVHPLNKIPGFDVEDLRLIYSGQLADWDFLGQAAQPLNAWAAPLDGEVWQLFTQVVLGSDVSLSREIPTAPSPERMREAVAADPGALGILPRRWVDATVRAVPVTDLQEGGLTRPILALSPAEPNGAVRAWLACLQERVK